MAEVAPGPERTCIYHDGVDVIAGDDSELLAAASAGSQDAWDAIVARYGRRIWSVARAHRLSSADAEDVHQITFMRLMTHIDSIREPSRMGAWLATTARNECLRILRRAGRSVLVGDDDRFDAVDPVLAPLDAKLIENERHAALFAALERLSERCQRLLRVLMADPEPTYEQVGEALGMPIGSIGPTRGRCLKHLRSELGSI
jgi:RNA polymerase sigma factor (sigma-70 family)